MWVIFQWIKKYSYPLVSLSLFSFSFYLVLQYQVYQHSLYFNNSVSFFRTVDTKRTEITQYWNLREQNEYLKEENKKLREALNINFVPAPSRFDSVFTDTNTNPNKRITYRYITAEVVRNSTNRINNYFIINQGESQGIEKGMAVLSPTGIAGIVVTTSKNFARVMSVLHSQFEITPLIPELNLRQGVVKWYGKNSKIGYVNEISRTEPVRKGFRILSSNYSSIFPPEVPIGTVAQVISSGQKEYHDIRIQFSTDFNRLQHVYCVKNMSLKELEVMDKTTSGND
jgi:rod shape-determining protein MreC